VICYASETGLLPLAQQIGGSGFVPRRSIPAIRRWLSEELRLSMIEMVEFSLKAGSPEPTVRFSQRDVDSIVSSLLKHLNSPRTAEALADTASTILATELREKSGKAFAGEKTPANIFALDAKSDARFNSIGMAPVFVVVRRPFPVLHSMRSRLANPADTFATVFSGDAAEQAGFYVRHALACARLVRRGAYLLRYEAFAGNVRGTLPKILSAIGVSTDHRSIEAINQRIDYLKRNYVRERFSSAEQAIIDALTEPVLTSLGYGRDPSSRSGEVIFDEGFRVLSGQYKDGLLARRSLVLLVAHSHYRHANLRLWHSFPGTIADGSDTVCWLAEGMDGRQLGSATAHGSGPAIVDLSIELNIAQGRRCADGKFMYLMEVACSHSFIPLVHPFRLGPCSLDVREVSGQILSAEFS
jgi:hypothetical protein